MFGAILVGFLPQSLEKRARAIALTIAAVSLGWSLWLGSQFIVGNTGEQFQEYLPWIKELGLNYHLGVDGLTLPLIVLNALLTWVALYSTSPAIRRPRLYYALVSIINAGVAGAFLSENFLLFFLFYELELIPLYLLIAIWGGPRRGYAATKFLIYTAISGALVLAACFGLGFLSGSFDFDYEALVNHVLPLGQQILLLGLLLVGFGIKIPLVPFHTWLPDAHVEASAPISVLLAGVLLKLGTYGLFRFGFGLFPDAWQFLSPWLASWAVVSILYGCFNAIAQKDMKKMVAYSSVGHMGYILLALAAATPLSLMGALLQMLSHGAISGLMFLLVGVIYAKTGTRDMTILKGLLNPERGLPLIGTLLIMGVMASAGIPGTIGFIAEFIVYRGSFQVFPVQTLLSMFGTILTVVYFLLLANRAFFGRLSAIAENLPVVQWRDRAPALILTVAIVIFGIQPAWLIRWSEPTITVMAPQSITARLNPPLFNPSLSTPAPLTASSPSSLSLSSLKETDISDL